MRYDNAFLPADNVTTSLAVTSTTGNRTLKTHTYTDDLSASSGGSILVYNAGPNDCFIRFGASGVVAIVPSGATVGDIPCPAGTYMLYGRQNGSTFIAAITDTAGKTATLYLTPGIGL